MLVGMCVCVCVRVRSGLKRALSYTSVASIRDLSLFEALTHLNSSLNTPSLERERKAGSEEI